MTKSSSESRATKPTSLLGFPVFCTFSVTSPLPTAVHAPPNYGDDIIIKKQQ